MLVDVALMSKLIAVGIGAGLVSGLAGLGGGIVIVPFLCLFMGLSIQSAVIISFTAVAINSISTTITKKKQYCRNMGNKKGRAKFNGLLKKSSVFKYGIGLASLTTGLVFGRYKDAISIHLIDALLITLVLVMIYSMQIRAFMITRFKNIDFHRQNKYHDFAFGGIIGFLSSLFGGTGGTYIINYFSIRYNVSTKDGTTITNYMGIIVGITGLVGFLISHLIKQAPVELGLSYTALIIFLLVGYGGSKVGVKCQHFLTDDMIKMIRYAIILGVVFKNEFPWGNFLQHTNFLVVVGLSAGLCYIAARLLQPSLIEGQTSNMAVRQRK